MSSRCWKTVIGHLFVLLFTVLVPSIWSEVSTSPMYLLYSQLWVWRKGPFDCAHHRSSPHCKQDGPWCRWRPPWCPSILRRAGHRPWSTWWSLSVIFWKHYSSVRQSQKEKKTTLDIEKDCCNKVRNKYPLLTNYITYCGWDEDGPCSCSSSPTNPQGTFLSLVDSLLHISLSNIYS